MSYKTLILHVEPTDLGRERIRVALTIAQIFDSRLVGIGARALNPMPDPIGLSIVKLREEVEAGLAAAEAVFRQEAASLGDSRCVWHAEVGFPTKILLRHASEADLVIAGRNVEGETEETHVGPADLIMSSGLPVLAVPAGAKFDLRDLGWMEGYEGGAPRSGRRAASAETCDESACRQF